MSWTDAHHLALDLFALGRVFFLTPLTWGGTKAGQFHPGLGMAVNTMLERAIQRGVSEQWYEAGEWCHAAEQSKDLEAVYRGTIDIEFSHAAARFVHCIVLVGRRQWVDAINGFIEVAQTLSFKLPDHSAAVWLSLAQVYCYHYDGANALWSIQRGMSLVQDRTGLASQALRMLLDAEFARVMSRCNV